MKGVILYKGKYGATRQYAQWLGEALQLPVFDEPAFSAADLKHYDPIIMGGSVYAGRWQMRRWLQKHASLLQHKKLIFFIVCATSTDDIKTLRDLAVQNLPADTLKTAPLFYLHGRVIKAGLSFGDKLLLKMGAWLTKDPIKKREMTTDFDDVKKEHLEGMIKVIRYEQQTKGAVVI